MRKMNSKINISSVATINCGCSRYEIAYSKALVRNGKNYYHAIKNVDKFRISTAAEELCLQLSLEKAGIDPRKAEIFNDLFGRNPENSYVWQLTATGLRVPKGWENGRIDADGTYPRIVLVFSDEVGENKIPKGGGRPVIEWNEFFGLPRSTSDNADDLAYNKHTTHFWFDPNPVRDKYTGHLDVAIERGGVWNHGNRGRCFIILADCGRWGAVSSAGFRPVYDSLHEIEKG